MRVGPVLILAINRDAVQQRVMADGRTGVRLLSNNRPRTPSPRFTFICQLLLVSFVLLPVDDYFASNKQPTPPPHFYFNFTLPEFVT